MLLSNRFSSCKKGPFQYHLKPRARILLNFGSCFLLLPLPRLPKDSGIGIVSCIVHSISTPCRSPSLVTTPLRELYLLFRVWIVLAVVDRWSIISCSTHANAPFGAMHTELNNQLNSLCAMCASLGLVWNPGPQCMAVWACQCHTLSGLRSWRLLGEYCPPVTRM